MAVAIEFVSVIIRKSAVVRCFPDGLDGFARQDLSNLSEDDHLLRVGFMSTGDAVGFISKLEEVGLCYLGPEADSDIAVVVAGTTASCPPWLSVGHVDGCAVCWASGYSVGTVAWPEPGFLLHCPRLVYHSLSEIVRRCGAVLYDTASGLEPGDLGTLLCCRGNAEIMINVIGEREGESPVGLWGRRQLPRREQFHADVALIRDLVATLVQAGAEDN